MRWNHGLRIQADLVAASEDELDPVETLRFATQEVQTSLAMIGLEPQNTVYAFELGGAYSDSGYAMWSAGRLGEAITIFPKFLDVCERFSAAGAFYLANCVRIAARVALWKVELGDSIGAAATIAAANDFLSPSAMRQLGPTTPAYEALFRFISAIGSARAASERGDFPATRGIARAALAALPAQTPGRPFVLRTLSDLEGQADYVLGDFAAAAQAERAALKAAKADPNLGKDVIDQRTVAQYTIWLSMALARERKRQEAAQTIEPIVQWYLGLMKKNHGDRWLPLEFAEALYAQSLSDPQRSAAHESHHNLSLITPGAIGVRDRRRIGYALKQGPEAASRKRG